MDDHTAADIRFWAPGAGVCFSDIDEFLASIPDDDDSIDLRLNCNGGDVATGWAIVDKLRASGKKITATVEGMAASMASVVLCAASERKAYPHAQILIHDPYFPEFSLYDSYKAEDLDKLSAQLKQETARILDFYVERTGADRDTLAAIMDEDRVMCVDEAKQLGFITEVLPAISARYKNPFNTNTMKNTKKQSAIAKAMQALQTALGLDSPKPVGYELETADGTTLTIDKPDGEDPAVGDSASPDGEHLMPDGTTIVVTDGVISEIRPAEGDGNSDDPDALTEDDINALIEQVNRLKANAKTAEEQQILDTVAKAGGKAWLDKAAASKYVPAPRASAKGSGEPKTSRVAQRLAELKAKND